MSLFSNGAELVVGSTVELEAGGLAMLAESRRLVTAIKDGTAPDTLAAYDDALTLLNDGYARADVAVNAHPDAAMRAAAQKCQQELQKLQTEIQLDRAVYDALGAVRLLADAEPATRNFLARVLRDFRRAGVDRDEPTRDQIRALQETLVRVGQEFDENITSDVRTVDVPAAALVGLPDDFIASHEVIDGRVRITTRTPDYLPFMTYSPDVDARRSLYLAYNQRGYPKNAEVLARLVAGRHELALLLGYPTWAAYITEDKMIGAPEAAAAFIDKISAAGRARMQRDYNELLDRKRQDQPTATSLDPWETAFYDDRVKAESYAFDSKSIRPYLPFLRVKEGVLSVTGRLFGLRYARVEAPVWHADVEVFDAFDATGNERIGRFYLDMQPRANKYTHAGMWPFTSGQLGRRLPEAVLMCNFPRPTPGDPGLMTIDETRTFFHEFGHLLHQLLGGRVRWAGQSGTTTEQDFVEVPSQLLEEWTRDAGVLATFARHYVTDEPLPAELVQRMRRAEAFARGMQVGRQMSLAALSLELYRRPPAEANALELARELTPRYTPFAMVEGNYFPLAFGHLNGYSAVYYTYMWSLVIAKDLFTRFSAAGLFDTGVARAYREAVLAPGSSRPATELVHGFLGRAASFDAYATWLEAAE